MHLKVRAFHRCRLSCAACVSAPRIVSSNCTLRNRRPLRNCRCCEKTRWYRLALARPPREERLKRNESYDVLRDRGGTSSRLFSAFHSTHTRSHPPWLTEILWCGSPAGSIAILPSLRPLLEITVSYVFNYDSLILLSYSMERRHYRFDEIRIHQFRWIRVMSLLANHDSLSVW